MHDSIQKFGKKLNCVFIRTLSETSNIVNVPWALKEIEGEPLNAEKLVDHFIATIIPIHPLPSHSNAFHEILSLVAPGTAGFFPMKPLEYLKACKLLFHEEKNKILALEMPDWPVAINADGCSTNISARDKLSKLFGLLTATIRCVAHAADVTLKQLANSKKMNVQESY